MNTRAASLLSVAAAATLAGGVPVGARLLRARDRNERKKESIDDVLRRARERRGKAAFDPSLDGTVRR